MHTWVGCYLTEDNGFMGYYGGIWLHIVFYSYTYFNSSRPGQNGRHFADSIFRGIFLKEKFCTLIKNSPNFVLKGPIDSNPALVYIMAWCWIGDKPLSYPVLTDPIHWGIYAALGGDDLIIHQWDGKNKFWSVPLYPCLNFKIWTLLWKFLHPLRDGSERQNYDLFM